MPDRNSNIMRDDMERSTRSLAEVFDDVVGPESEIRFGNEESLYGRIQAQAPELVYDIINRHELVLSLAQWQVVQTMMQEALMAGVDLVGTAGR